MKQLLERKHGTRTIVFALLLTMLAWLAPANVGVAKAADMTKDSTLKVGKPLYQKCAGKTYSSKIRTSDGYWMNVSFGKASKGKIKLYLIEGYEGSSDFVRTKFITGKVKGKTIKFKANKWYTGSEMGLEYLKTKKISGTITLKSSNTIKLKITSGKSNFYRNSYLRPGKTTTLKK